MAMFVGKPNISTGELAMLLGKVAANVSSAGSLVESERY